MVRCRALSDLVEERVEAVVPDLARQVLDLYSHTAELAAGQNNISQAYQSLVCLTQFNSHLRSTLTQ